ncbi:coiled-coil domain-containing protein [Paenibacillus sp. SN-8-1]|uniref:coiled-coil domain-containing protein n=1 Tax=Paenibacillus sp. SN-8-1 TaxID=3435409 RepID=UPI003D9A2D7C
MLRRCFLSCSLLMFCSALILFPCRVHAEDPLSEETRKLLEKSLSIVEIDREIKKTEQLEAQAQSKMDMLSTELEAKQAQISASQSQTDDRIRAYYMGEREDLIGALLSTESISDFISVLDIIDMIFERDHDILGDYQKAYRSLVDTRDKQNQLLAELTELKSNLLIQRERVSKLQASVNSSLQGSSDAERLKALMEEMNAYWNNVGLFEVRRHFKALADAMVDLPEFLKNNGNSITASGTNYTISIKQEDLNAFLKSENEIFNNFAFTFEEGKIIAEGKQGSLQLRVEGHYTIENKPQNSIQFHVDKLIFNGLTLPDTTCRELENEFDLGFYPKLIIPLVEASDVTLQKGLLIIKLKLAL